MVVRVQDASSPANASELSVTLPARSQPLLRGLDVARGRVSGRVVADAAARVRIWAYPKGRVPHLVGTYPARCRRQVLGSRAARSHDALRRCGSREPGAAQPGRARRRHRAGARPHRRAARSASAATGLPCAPASRAEARPRASICSSTTCAEDAGSRPASSTAGPGVRLERTGRVWGTCTIPPSARGRAWTYRLVLAAPSSTWPWRTPSSGSVSVLLPL